MSEEKWKYECACCPQRINCERTFGRYWGGKSHGAKGCYYGFGDMGEAERRVERSSTVKAEAKPAEPKRETLVLKAESVKEPWEIAHVTKGTSAGVHCTNKRNNFGKSRQEILCLR